MRKKKNERTKKSTRSFVKIDTGKRFLCVIIREGESLLPD